MEESNTRSEAMLRRSSRASNSFGRELHRAEILATIISKARVVCSLPALEPDDLVAAVSAWEEILSDIPGDWLDECYRRAMRSHRIRSPFSASEVYQAWEQVAETSEYKSWRAERRKRILSSQCPDGCDGGWIFVDASGARSGVKPCPVHRPDWKR